LRAPLCSESRLSRLIPRLRQATVFGLSAMVLMALAFPAQGGNVDLVTNGSFSNIGTETTSFVIAGALVSSFPLDTGTLPGWTGTGAIVCLVAGTPTTNFCGIGSNLWPGPGLGPGGVPLTGPTIGPPSGLGPNFVAIDADTYNNDGGYISQTISVVPGQSYQVSFDQAASQLVCCTVPTTEQWLVSFDVLGGGCDPESSTNSTTCQSQSSQQMTNPSEGFWPWMSQTMTFTAPPGSGTTENEVLSFFAFGGPHGGPPIALLDGVSVVASPEPATYTFMGIGLVGVLAVFRKRLKKRG